MIIAHHEIIIPKNENKGKTKDLHVNILQMSWECCVNIVGTLWECESERYI
jgi:hypothetical protein